MKKNLIIITLILCISIGCSKKEENKNNSEVKQSNITEKIEKKDMSYEESLIERMNILEQEAQKSIDSGVTSEMTEATSELRENWDKELKAVYDLLLEKLSPDKKTNLESEQENWIKEKEKEVNKTKEEFGEGTMSDMVIINTDKEMIKNRTIELAKMYDELK